MKPEMKKVVDGLLNGNPEAKKAHKAMVDRGVTDQEADAEIARVLLACLHDAWKDPKSAEDSIRPSLDTALKALESGKTAVDIFPDA